MDDHPDSLHASPIRKQIVAGFSVLLFLLVALAAVAFRIMTPVEAGADRVRDEAAKAAVATEVSLRVGDARAAVAQYALSSTLIDQKVAQESLTSLNQATKRIDESGRDTAGLINLAGLYRESVNRTFAAVDLRRASIEQLQAAGTELHTITSAIVEAFDSESGVDRLRAGMQLSLSFYDANMAVSRFLASRGPADLEDATNTLALLPANVDALAALAAANHRIPRFAAALHKPLAVYLSSLQAVAALDNELRRLAAERTSASDAALAGAATQRVLDMKLEHEAVVSMLTSVSSMRHLLLAASLTALIIGLVLAVLSGRAVMAQFRRLTVVQDALQTKSSLLEATLANMDQGLIVATPEHKVGVVNDSAQRLLKLPTALALAGAPFEDILEHQRKRLQCTDEISPLSRSADFLGHPHLCEMRDSYGTVLEVRNVPLPRGGAVQTYTDITERALAAARIVHAAEHDVLTCLPNRILFEARLSEAITSAEACGKYLAILFLDLDRFKSVNDTLGHSAGDELLTHVANRMRQEVRKADTLSRIGGDEFAVVIPDISGPDVALLTAERLRNSVRNPYTLKRGTAYIGVSIGVACYPTHGRTAEELLDFADLALYRAKAAGRNACCMFDEEIDKRTQEEMILEGDLQGALLKGEFELEYQPIIKIDTGEIAGFEALVRWRHPTKGLIYPHKFIPLAERTGLIIELGGWVMEAACREALSWATPISVSVNVAPAQLRRSEIAEDLRGLLKRTGLPAERLKLEITEGQLLDETPAMVATLFALREIGVSLTLDDFGTGYSSFMTLRAFPLTEVKIDCSFTHEIAQDNRSQRILQAILEVCRILRLDCIVEGVETKDQLALLERFGCGYAQGFFIGKPAAPVEIRERLRKLASVDEPVPPPKAAQLDSSVPPSMIRAGARRSSALD